MGASGHNAAQAVLADAGGGATATTARQRSAGSKGVIDRIMETDTGRKAGYKLARYKAFRPLVKRASKRREELMRLEGKGAVVTGGGRGLGREVVLLMAGEGAGVVVFDVNAEGAEAVAAEAREAGGRAVAFEGDVTSEEDLAAAIARCREEFGSFDVIHNNAGVQVEKPLHESTSRTSTSSPGSTSRASSSAASRR